MRFPQLSDPRWQYEWRRGNGSWNDGEPARYEVLQILDNTGAVVWEGNDGKVSDSVMERFGGPSFKWEYVGFIETGGCFVKLGWNTATRFEEYRLGAKQ